VPRTSLALEKTKYVCYIASYAEPIPELGEW